MAETVRFVTEQIRTEGKGFISGELNNNNPHHVFVEIPLNSCNGRAQEESIYLQTDDVTLHALATYYHFLLSEKLIDENQKTQLINREPEVPLEGIHIFDAALHQFTDNPTIDDVKLALYNFIWFQEIFDRAENIPESFKDRARELQQKIYPFVETPPIKQIVNDLEKLREIYTKHELYEIDFKTLNSCIKSLLVLDMGEMPVVSGSSLQMNYDYVFIANNNGIQILVRDGQIVSVREILRPRLYIPAKYQRHQENRHE